MSIKFPRFPALVRLAIINEMSYTDVFNLSLCSSKTRKFIENYRKRDVKIVRYFFISKGIQVFVGNKTAKDLLNQELALVATAKRTVHQASFTKIGSVQEPVSFKWQEEKNFGFYMKITFNSTSEESIKKAVLEHITALFKRSSPVTQLQILIDHRLGKVIHIPGVKDTRIIRGEQVDGKYLDEFFKEYPEQSSAAIDPKLTGRLSVVSNIYLLQALTCQNSSQLSASILKRFRGEELRLWKAECTTRDIVSFLKSWISNKRRCLKFLHIHFSTPVDKQEIIRHFRLRRWSLEPHLTEFKTNVIDLIAYKKTFDCREGWQVQRREDKKMAVLFFYGTTLYFIVWDRTRDQFVEVNQ